MMVDSALNHYACLFPPNEIGLYLGAITVGRWHVRGSGYVCFILVSASGSVSGCLDLPSQI